jgi:tRNA1(Val) A37 N6-methylase TrmN6
MIHRPERLAQIFSSLSKHGLEPKQLQLIQPFADQAANLVLIEARKNARPGIKLLPALNVR